MDDTIKYGAALIFLSAAIIYVTIKNRSRNQERENKEKDIELVIYKKEIERLEEQLKIKEISMDDYEKLRKKLEEQHQKNMVFLENRKVKS